MCEVLLRRPRAAVRAIRLTAERTPPHRDRHLDLLRAVAIAAVVLGHWLAVVVTYHGGFGGDTVLAVLPWARPLTWAFQVMPVFFLVGGFVNAASLDSYRRRGGTATGWLLGRTDRLIRPTTALLLTLSAAALLALLLGVGEGTVATAVWLAVMPLWFLVAYLAVVLLTPVMLALHRRAGLAVPVVLAALVGLGDAVRIRSGPPLLGQAGFLFAWLAIHQLGIAWREGALPTRRTVALPMAAGGSRPWCCSPWPGRTRSAWWRPPASGCRTPPRRPSPCWPWRPRRPGSHCSCTTPPTAGSGAPARGRSWWASTP